MKGYIALVVLVAICFVNSMLPYAAAQMGTNMTVYGCDPPCANGVCERLGTDAFWCNCGYTGFMGVDCASPVVCPANCDPAPPQQLVINFKFANLLKNARAGQTNPLNLLSMK
eukprot:TRINITY_DN25975_c0_g1_i1.p1 TRINITY_DN25975_c0_g1~~TRINITY_DN25975_c0_g1_i1.p1  ORF type:complete len:113 (+),score=23.35 TRINITY_DN25975_c0_g1_i1:110-448(+)